jgi:adenylosuccinate lyase
LTEAIQTILRKSGKTNAYEQLKNLTRGESINAESLAKFISGLKISDEYKRTLLNLRPKSYTGLSSKLVDLI